MLRRTVLAALEIGIDSRDEDAARKALRASDPIARGAAKRRLKRALIDAALACDAARVPSPAPEHVMRIAALSAGRDPGDVRDANGVLATYQSLGRTSVPRFPLYTVALVAVLAALVGGVTSTSRRGRDRRPARTCARCRRRPPTRTPWAACRSPIPRSTRCSASS